MGKATLQKFWEKHIWNAESEVRSLENPNTPFTTENIWGGQRSTAGVSVNADNALKISAVWRCVNIISGIISAFDCKPYIEIDDVYKPAKDHPTYKLFKRRPNPLYTKTVYWERAIIHLLLRGNHFSEIVYQRNGIDIKQFNLFQPQNVELRFTPDGRLIYYVKDANGTERGIPMERMIHVPHLGEDPLMGKSVITYAREDLGMEMARMNTGGKFWNDGGQMTQVAVTQSKLSEPQMAELKKSFKDKKKEGGLIVAPYGVDVKNVSMTPADQEFIMSGNFSIASICRWFGVPLHKLSELDRATLNNVEQMAIEFTQDTIAPIVEKIENEYETKCYTLESEQNMDLEFDMNSYQRADSQGRAESNRTAIQNGYMSPNEAAREDGRPPVEGGNRRFIQQNMMPLDKVDEVLTKASKPAQIGKNNFSARLKEQARELLELAETEYKVNGNGNH